MPWSHYRFHSAALAVSSPAIPSVAVAIPIRDSRVVRDSRVMPLSVVADERQAANVLLRDASDAWLLGVENRYGDEQWRASIAQVLRDC